MPRTQKGREKLLDAAARQFYKNGYKATGVDAIAKAAGVTKATLYHHFESKDHLIAEALSYLSALHRQEYEAVWAKKGLKPLDKLTVLFDAMESFFAESECYGCPFINASGEFTDRSSPARQIAQAHYAFLLDRLEQFAREANLAKPRGVAEKIAGVTVGAYTGWYVAGLPAAAKQGKELALMIISKHRKDH